MRFNILLLSAIFSISFWVINAAPIELNEEVLSESNESEGKPTGFGTNNSVKPNPGKGRDGKIRETGEVLAVESFKQKEPNHPAAAPGNTATVNDSFHKTTPSGATHITVDFNSPEGDHVSRLHIAKDGTRLKGDAQPPAHAGGDVPPPNSPKNSRTSSPKPGSSKSGNTTTKTASSSGGSSSRSKSH